MKHVLIMSYIYSIYEKYLKILDVTQTSISQLHILKYTKVMRRLRKFQTSIKLQLYFQVYYIKAFDALINLTICHSYFGLDLLNKTSM